MQQEHGRRARGSGFAVEDIDAVDRDGAVVDDRDRSPLRYAGRRLGVSQRKRRDRCQECGRKHEGGLMD